MRPEHEQKIDEAAAAVQLFERLRSAAQRTLFEAQQGHEEYLPRLPSEGRVQLAASQVLADPTLQVRLALLAGAFLEPAPPPAPMPVAPPPATTQAAPESAQDEDEEPEEQADTTPPGAHVPAQNEPKPTRAGIGQADIQAKIGKLIGSIRDRKWGPAEAQVRNFPPAIKEHWTTVLRKARSANDAMSTITHDNLDAAGRIAAEIDCLPVRESIDQRVAYLRQGLPPRPTPEPPARRERRPPPLPAQAQERAEPPPPLAPTTPEPAPTPAHLLPPPLRRRTPPGGA